MALRLNSGPARRRQESSTSSVMIMAAAIVVAAFILSKRDHGREGQAEAKTAVVAEFDTVSVPVPVAAVPAGIKVKEIAFHNVAYPRHQLPAGAILSLAPVTRGGYCFAPASEFATFPAKCLFDCWNK